MIVTKRALILVLSAQVLISITLVEGGIFDGLIKNQNDSKLGNKQSESASDYDNNTGHSGRHVPPRLKKNRSSEQEPDDEAAEVAKQLEQMDKAPHRKKPSKLNKLLDNARREQEQAAAAAAAQEEQYEEEQEDQKPAARGVARRPRHGPTAGVEKPALKKPTDAQRAPETQATRPAGRIKRPIRPLEHEGPKHPHLSAIMASKVMQSKFWKKNIKDAYVTTKDAVKELPTVVKEATDNLSALLKLDNRGRLLALLKEVEEDILFVRGEFSTFSITWAPIMERALSYIGKKNLNKLYWSERNELDLRGDALNTAAFGYEFMNLMMEWRQQLMLAHQAYKEYLLEVMQDQEREKFTVDEEYMFQLGLIHNYMLLNSWLDLDVSLIEYKLKLDHLSLEHDMKEKNYESVFFRDTIVLQEIYDPTIEEFRNERNQVIEALSQGGENEEQFKDIDDYFEQFKKDLEDGNVDFGREIDWNHGSELANFMEEMRPELKYNQKVYDKAFLKELKEAKENAENEAEADNEE